MSVYGPRLLSGLPTKPMPSWTAVRTLHAQYLHIMKGLRNFAMTDERWHLSKSVSIAHIATTVLLVGGIFGYIIKQDQRITRVEERQAVVDQRMDREVSRTAEDLALIRQSLQRMEDRMERLMDRERRD